MITIQGKEIKTSIDEMMLQEFEPVSKILADETLSNLEKYYDVLEALGAPEDVLENMSEDEFFLFIKQLNMNSVSRDLVKTVTLEGKVYTAYDEEFKLKIKDLTLIEKTILNDSNFMCRIAAILFKEEGVTDHYEKGYMDKKTTLFKEFPASALNPYLIYISEKINKKLVSFNAAS